MVISLMLAQKYVRKDCEAYFAYVLDTKLTEMKIESVPVVYDYLDVFPEELPGLPPIQEVALCHRDSSSKVNCNKSGLFKGGLGGF